MWLFSGLTLCGEESSTKRLIDLINSVKLVVSDLYRAFEKFSQSNRLRSVFSILVAT